MATKKTKLLTPKEIKAYLDERVIGQEETKKILSVAVYNHYKRLENLKYETDVHIDKSNVLLIGPTGSGKTFMVQTIANLLDVPCYIQDCTKITEAGYVGSDVEDCLVGLLRSCNYDIRKAERGIVMLDEIDKCASRNAGTSITRDVAGEGVQQALLKIVEGDVVGVPPMGGRKHPEQPLLYVNTKNILFIASGAFANLDRIIERRIGTQQVGFDVPTQTKTKCPDLLSQITTSDIRKFGMIPEFIGRFPIITHTDALTEDDLVRILTEPKNALVKQYQELLRYDKTLIRFSNEVLREIAHRALYMKTGARGLRGIMEQVMLNIMYDAPDNRSKRNPVVVQVTPDMLSSLNEVA